ncbi:hypothetical protein C1H46_038029 [Malus baccata]|uniref:non-specific serine/threonine protein kinase n=2 Tax=Malus TaxID=3749 RepID=A0A540KR12_MALBA|nr:hypothetical protein C1H46_038029 [Malus baccata]
MPVESSNASDRDAEPFVEVDPTGRYGRYADLLGHGAVKKVYRAFDQEEGTEVAWNQVRLYNYSDDPTLINRLYSEVKLLRQLKNKYIIVCHSVWKDEAHSTLNFITEVCNSGNLREYREKHRRVSLKALKKWSRQVLEGLEYLHTHEPCIIHRDLNCSNIFINGNTGQVKIGDLGFAAIVGKNHLAHSIIGTPEYMAPELYDEDYTEMVDIYSFGMCLLEMVTMEIPYSECDSVAKIYRKVTTGVKPLALNKVTDPEVKAFIEKAIAQPRARPTASDLLKDPFLSEVSQAWFRALPMEVASPLKDSSVSSSPFSSPNVSALLKIKILSCVRVGGKIFNLHKWILNKRLNESNEIDLPPGFPGGPETFEMIALLIYGSSTLIDPFNVVALRCAAEFLEMTEDYSSGNLCERFDLYLNLVVMQSWDDTLIVLQKCQTLLPWSEDLLIVSRCIECLTFMACMEILDHERRHETPVLTLGALGTGNWSCETGREIMNQDVWIKDLIALPFGFLKRIIGSLRRQGMKEKYLSPIIVFYANKWVLSTKTLQFWENSGQRIGYDHKVSVILQGVLDLLLMGDKASRSIPVGFYLAILSRSLEVGLRINTRVKLQGQIVSLLHFAQLEDFLFPKSGSESISSSMELATMESIISANVSSNMESDNSLLAGSTIVAELWYSTRNNQTTQGH